MSPEAALFVIIGIGLLVCVVLTVLIERWSHRRRLFGPDTSSDDQHQNDILKRGEICPWPRTD